MADKSILEVAKSQLIAFNDKNWDAAKAALATDTVYEEVATQRRIEGVEETLSAWKGWAKAFPDAEGDIENETVGDNTVTIELTWRAIHTGPLLLPAKTSHLPGRRSSCVRARSLRSHVARSKVFGIISTYRACSDNWA